MISSRHAQVRCPRRVRVLATLIVSSVGLATLAPGATADLMRGKDVLLSPYQPYDVAAADFNGDGVSDLALTGSDSVLLLPGRGDGTFKTGKEFAVGSRPENVAVGDLNRDGKVDFVVANTGSDNVSVLLGRGNGTFERRANYRVGQAPAFVALGRLNGDRYPDLAVTNLEDNTVSVLLGKGDGTFKRQHSYGAGSTPRTVAIGDLNGDGKTDLAVTDFANVALLKGHGDGTFTRKHDVGMHEALWGVQVGDYNRDGRADLLVNNTDYNSFQGIHLLRGRGQWRFKDSTQFTFDSSVNKFAASNIIGGSARDLVAETEGYPLGFDNDQGYLYVMQGHRNGTFTDAVTKKLDGDGGRFAVGDLNGDGRRDIAAITYAPAPKIEIFLNR
jgi:hypothetical protein